MKRPIRIAISGKMASGKTTTSNYLVDEKGFRKYSFALYVKGIAMAIADMNYVRGKEATKENKKLLADAINGLEEICLDISKDATEFNKVVNYVSKIKEDFKDVVNTTTKDKRVRELYQAIGDGFTRNIREDIWADVTIRNMEHYHGNCNIVIDDLRYPHEVETLKKYGFTIIRLEVNDEERLKRVHSLYKNIEEEQLNNRSEKALDRYIYKGIRAFTVRDKSIEDIKVFLDYLLNEEEVIEDEAIV